MTFLQLRASASRRVPLVSSHENRSIVLNKGLPSSHRRKGRSQLPRFPPKASAEKQKTADPGDFTQQQASSGRTGPKYNGRSAIVVGAGPAGTTASAFLAQQGFNVKIFEKRGDPTTVLPKAHRSIFITLKPSAIAVLRHAEMDLPPELGGYLNGVTRFNGSFTITPKNMMIENRLEEDFMLVGERHDIATCLFTSVQKKYSDKVQFFFHHTCQGVAFDAQTVTFLDGDGKHVTEHYDLLIAADGVNSTVRDELQEFDPDLKIRRIHAARTYKSIRSLMYPPEKSDVADSLQPGWLTFARTRTSKFRGRPSPSRISYYPSQEDGVHGLIVGTAALFDNIKGQEEEWAQEALPAYFPTDWKKEISRQLKDVPMAYVAPIMHVSKFTGPRTVLLGDSSHSVTPALGIGCNMAIVDNEALNTALNHSAGDIDEAVRLFNILRYQDVQKTQELQESVPGQCLQLPLFRLWWPVLGAVHLGISVLGNRFLPQIIPRNVYLRFASDEISSQKAVSILKRDGLIILSAIHRSIALLG